MYPSYPNSLFSNQMQDLSQLIGGDPRLAHVLEQIGIKDPSILQNSQYTAMLINTILNSESAGGHMGPE